MSVLAERQSVTKTRSIPACCSAATRLCRGARSVIAAPWSAKGAQTRVAGPSEAVEKPRNRTVASSSTTLLRVANCGSGAPVSVPGPTARFMNSRAIAEANSLAVSAASAGQRNARGGNCGPPVPRMSISPGRDRGCGIEPNQTAWQPGAQHAPILSALKSCSA